MLNSGEVLVYVRKYKRVTILDIPIMKKIEYGVKAM